MSFKGMLVAALAAAAVVSVAPTAGATETGASPIIYIVAVAPGVAMGTGALVTTIGSAATLAADDPSMGWGVTSIVIGSLSVVSGGIYTTIVAENNASPGVFGSLAVTNFALGASSLVLGIVSVTAEPSPEVMAFVPRVAIDGEGRRFAVVGGDF